MEQVFPIHQVKILEKNFNEILLKIIEANSKYMRALNDEDFKEMRSQILILNDISEQCKKIKERLHILDLILEN
jgi:hypothetical protein